jgi:hypothetical protein
VERISPVLSSSDLVFPSSFDRRNDDDVDDQTAVDPTDPAVRCGLGLTYLLLGTMEYDTADDDNDNDESSLQYIFRSIQHLRAAVGLVDAASSEREGRADDDGYDGYDEAIDAIRYATLHNLGLAYIALDGKSPSLDGGMTTTHFADWVRSLPAVMNKSLALLSNVGAMTLQMGMFEDAASRLGSIASEFCGTDSLSSSRQEEACSIIRRNLDVAWAALNGETEGPNVHVRAKDVTSVVNQLDRDASSSRREDIHISSEDDDVSNTVNKTLEVLSFVEEDGESKSNSFVGNESMSSSLRTNNTEEVIDPIITQWDINTVKPEMRNALAALEKAATEGTQRTRLLLALARARSSTGDLAGAVDASLKAIDAATSGDEMESSTSYLESLMETMAKQSNEEMVILGSAPEAQEETPTSRDYSLLEMKLEVERLKYKVLEQEMRLSYRKHSPNPVDDLTRVIGYQKQEYTITSDVPRRALSEIKQNKVTSQILTTHVDHVPDEIHEIQIESKVAADESLEASSIVADDGGPVLPESGTSNSNIVSSSITNVTSTEHQNPDAASDTDTDAQTDAIPSTKTDAEVDIDFKTEEDAQSSTKNNSELTLESNSEPEVGPNAETIVYLPVLFSPELKSPSAIP